MENKLRLFPKLLQMYLGAPCSPQKISLKRLQCLTGLIKCQIEWTEKQSCVLGQQKHCDKIRGSGLAHLHSLYIRLPYKCDYKLDVTTRRFWCYLKKENGIQLTSKSWDQMYQTKINAAFITKITWMIVKRGTTCA